MIFRRRRSEPSEGTGRASETGAAREQSCPSLGKALERTFRLEHPSILDLGPMSGSTVTALASRGARVTVEEFEPPATRTGDDVAEGGEEGPAPIKLEHPDDVFDLILAWEQVDFVPPDRLEEFFAELRRVLARDGWLLMFSQARAEPRSRHLVRYRIVDDGHIVREAAKGKERPRWTHPTRAIERALRGFSVQGIHLQRSQVREILAAKREVGKQRLARAVQPRRPTHAKPVRR